MAQFQIRIISESPDVSRHLSYQTYFTSKLTEGVSELSSKLGHNSKFN